MNEPRLILDLPLPLGEGPMWDFEEQCLWWTDIEGRALHRYDPAANEHVTYPMPMRVGGFTRQEGGEILLFGDAGRITAWDGTQFTDVHTEVPAEQHTRFNDVIADPSGRVFCGTMATGTDRGRLYRLETNGELIVVLEDIGCSNGLGFSPDLGTMYYIDTPRKEVWAFDYDQATGDISNRRVAVDLREAEGAPDGMTVDVDGNLWVAFWGGSRVERFSPQGHSLGAIPFPATNVTSLAIGGIDGRTAYVTSAGGDRRPEAGPHAGALFAFSCPAAGRKEFRSRIAR